MNHSLVNAAIHGFKAVLIHLSPPLLLNPPACEIHLNPFFFTVHSSSKQGVCRMSSFCSSNLPEEASVKADEQGSQAMAWIRIRLNLSKNRIASL